MEGNMDESAWYAERRTAIHMLRSGKTAKEVSIELGRSIAWVYKWRARFAERENWHDLRGQSRAPKRPKRLAEATKAAIRQARSELEDKAVQPDQLAYIGSGAVRERLRLKGIKPMPSKASIDRVLAAAGMTRPKKPKEKKITYPRLHPKQPHQLCQVDIVPQYFRGGQAVACFNGLDVVSRYPAGQQLLNKRSQDAMDCLVHIWQELGIPTYTQLDNESCFSGGFTHRAVLGKVLRLGLFVGTELVFSPVHHPESNGYVERFHQDYLGNVWKKCLLEGLADVQEQSQRFYQLYRHSRHHSALNGCTPTQLHTRLPIRPWPKGFSLPGRKLPLTTGQVHFIRLVNQERVVRILNVDWSVPSARPEQGVWATLTFTFQGAMLRVYDDAPDATQRRYLAKHPFPLPEPVKSLQSQFCPPRSLSNSVIRSVTHVVRRTVRNPIASWFSTML